MKRLREKLRPPEIHRLEEIAKLLTLAQLNRADDAIQEVLGVIEREKAKRIQVRQKLRRYPPQQDRVFRREKRTK